MKLKTLLIENRQAILDRWLTLILKTYPADAARFMKQNPNRFSNPVGHTFSEHISVLFDALVGEADSEAIRSSLEQINKIRAVQDFSASRAVAFIFLLKTAIRERLTGRLHDGRLAGELLNLESEIDGMALAAFDSFMQCREKLFEIKCRDIKRRASLFATPDNDSIKHRKEIRE